MIFLGFWKFQVQFQVCDIPDKVLPCCSGGTRNLHLGPGLPKEFQPPRVTITKRLGPLEAVAIAPTADPWHRLQGERIHYRQLLRGTQ